MGRRKFSEEELAIAKKNKNRRSCVLIHASRQEALAKRMSDGDNKVQKCECGKLYDVGVYTKLENMVDSERQRCVKCPLKPEMRSRRIFAKRSQQWVIRLEKR